MTTKLDTLKANIDKHEVGTIGYYDAQDAYNEEAAYGHIRDAEGYELVVEQAKAAIALQDTPWEEQRQWTKEQRMKLFLTGTYRGEEESIYPLAVHNGLVFVEHPEYGDGAAFQILKVDGTITASDAMDIDDLKYGNY